MDDLVAARERYAAELQRLSNVQSAALVRAFGRVPREHYLGPGPWQTLGSGGPGPPGWFYQTTPDDDPVHLYRNVLVAIDASRMLNNGQPSAHAMWMDALDPRPGEHVVHVGCGVGYYTAILADVVGASGRVTGIEVAPELAARARANFAGQPSVRIIAGDGCAFDPGPADGIYVNAGATHILPLWVERLRPGGRLVMPLVRWPANPAEIAGSGAGIVLRISRDEVGWSARVVSWVGIFPCLGAVDADADRALAEAFGRGVETGATFAVRLDRHDRDAGCWLHGSAVCLRQTPSAM